MTLKASNSESAAFWLLFADIRLAVSLQCFATEFVEKLNDAFVAHELGFVIVIIMHDLFQWTPHPFRRLHRRVTDRDDEIQHHEIRHAQNFLERFLDVDADPLCSEPERS